MINIKNWFVMKFRSGCEYDESRIPAGFYCYTIIEEPSIFNNFTLKKKRCPYYLKISTHSCGCRVTGEIETWGTIFSDENKICGIKD